MIVTGDIGEVRKARWQHPTLSWGLVPTMGFLHEGHLSLVRRARADNDRLAVTIFVNPTQFGPNEDLDKYPRDFAHDLNLLAAESVDLVFAPDPAVMYPSGFQTRILIEQITRRLEGARRPAHFQGVATVVAKLFNIVEPTRAYFGQKDAQQVLVLNRLKVDLDFNVELVICPIIRESDGLAMSSRNSRLEPAQRRAAVVLYRALDGARASFKMGERNADRLRELMHEIIAAEPQANIDYVSVADPENLCELKTIENRALLSVAVSFGDVRLIDNMLVPSTGGLDLSG